MLAKRETQRCSVRNAGGGGLKLGGLHAPYRGYAIAWWNRYFKDLAESEPKRIQARRSMADAKAEKEDLESKLAQLQSINKDEFRQGPPSQAHVVCYYSMGMVIFMGYE